jgi:uncharacterized protein YbjT (DUF2867 family)
MRPMIGRHVDDGSAAGRATIGHERRSRSRALLDTVTGMGETKQVLVTGGTGTLGTQVVERLVERGQKVRVLSRRARTGREGVEFVIGDLVSGVGAHEAVAGVDGIVHCASASRGDAEASRHLVTAAMVHGTRPHLVYISIVGVDGVRFGYFQAKLAAEQVVVESGLPWTILRATQFYDYILNGSRSMARFPIVPVPKDFLCQAIDVREVADRLADLALGPPSGRMPDIGGPGVSTWADMLRQYLRATRRRRLVVPLPMPGTRAIRSGGLLVAERQADPDGTTGRQTWQRFLAETIGR